MPFLYFKLRCALTLDDRHRRIYVLVTKQTVVFKEVALQSSNSFRWKWRAPTWGRLLFLRNDSCTLSFWAEYTEEEMLLRQAEGDRERARRGDTARTSDSGTNRWQLVVEFNTCQTMQYTTECFCCHEWDILEPMLKDLERSTDAVRPTCVTSHHNFSDHLNNGVLDTLFLKKHKNRLPVTEGPDGEWVSYFTSTVINLWLVRRVYSNVMCK